MKTIFSSFSKRERLLAIAVACLIAGAGVYILAVEPLYRSWGGYESELNSARAKLAKNLKLLANKESIEKEYDKYKAYIHDETAGEEESASVLREIESNAQAAGVAIISIKPKAVKELKDYGKSTIELTSEAALSQFMKFIYDLEGSKELLKVERIVLSLKSNQTDILKGTLIIRKISFPKVLKN
jgi:hypothetical protein